MIDNNQMNYTMSLKKYIMCVLIVKRNFVFKMGRNTIIILSICIQMNLSVKQNSVWNNYWNSC